MSTPNYTDRERQVRALLKEEATRILLANPSLIRAEVQIRSGDGCSTTVFLYDRVGEMHVGVEDNLIGAVQSGMSKVVGASKLAAIKREQAARLLADAARLEESAT